MSVFVCYDAYPQHNDVLKPLHDKIKAEFINKSSAYIAQQMREKKSVPDEFQQFLDEDELVKKMQQTFRDGTGKFSVEVINKKDEIINNFQHKIDELYAENKRSITKENVAKVGMGLSILMGIAGASNLVLGRQHEKQLGGILAGLGVVGGIGGWVIWSWSAQEQKEKQIHITEAATMKEKWAQGFKIKVNE